MATESQPFLRTPNFQQAIRLVLPILHARGIAIVAMACGIGAMAGVLAAGMSWTVQEMHRLLYGLPPDTRLSSALALSEPQQALVPVIGGVVMGLTVAYLRKRRYRRPVDPIEANALHGGRMSIIDTVIIGLQTIISSGFGASVGLEAGYTQLGAGVASRVGRFFGMRRNNVRLMVGCGAAGAIAAAFAAPLAGAFYGFELIIGVYTVGNVAPVLAAALCGSLTARSLGALQFPIFVDAAAPMTAAQYAPFLLLGLIGAIASIVIMQLVTKVERLFSRLSIDATLRPAIGGCIVGLLALGTPQVLSSGHGAMHVQLAMNYGLATVAGVFALKLMASAVSLGSGFRGGLFFASLLLGALLGKMFAAALAIFYPASGVDPNIAAVIGMTSLAVGVVGGPLTMTFLALESTGNLTLTGVVLASSIISAMIVRETFGYSFSTWRLHLRGETIRSANDVGWMRSLTVGSMMRADVRTVSADTSLAAFKKRFPLGSAQRVVAVDAEQRYVGILIVTDVHAEDADTAEAAEAPVGALAQYRDAVLLPSMNVKIAADLFQGTGSEELAVVGDLYNRKVVGLLTEGHLMRRYTEELEKARRDLSGEG